MANVDFPKGFRPITNFAGTAPRLTTYTAVDSVAFYEGQPVALNGDGKVCAWVVDATYYKTGLGVVAGYLAVATTDRTVQVYDDVNQEYEVQSDGATIAGIGTLIGINFGVTNISSGTASTGQSIAEITHDSGSASNDSTTPRPFRGIRFATDPKNEIASTNPRIIVKMNQKNHILTGESTALS